MKKYKTDSEMGGGDHSEEKQPWGMKPPPEHGAEKRCRNGRLMRIRKSPKE
jgi:hypothetical protein